MNARRQLRTILGSLAVLLALSLARYAGWSQMQTGVGSTTTGSIGAGTTNRGRHGLDDEDDPTHGNLPESFARMQSTERQKRLVGDTERLLSLTNQLKVSIAASGSETLTPEMLRQMDEIEKLARSVKNKMRN